MKVEMVGTQAADLDLPDAAEHDINIEFDDFRTFLKDFSANIALKGMLVETAEPQPPGAEVAFKLSLSEPSRKSVFRSARVLGLKRATERCDESSASVAMLARLAPSPVKDAVVEVRFSTSMVMSMAAELLVFGTAVVVEDE